MSDLREVVERVRKEKATRKLHGCADHDADDIAALLAVAEAAIEWAEAEIEWEKAFVDDSVAELERKRAALHDLRRAVRVPGGGR
jgi:hypothetical protein